MTWLRSLLYQIAFLSWTLLLVLLMLPMLGLASRRRMQTGAAFWLDGALFLQRVVLGIAIDIQGRENLPTGGAILAVKHQSAWETMIFHRLVGDPAFVIKKELLSLPFIGWYLRKTGQIAIDRKAGIRALKLMTERARQVLAEGRTVVIFPEGHRQPPGMAGHYHTGIAMLYAAAGAPVVPVALNSGLYWGRNAFLRRQGTIRLRLLTPIPPGLERAQFMSELETRIETATRELENEAVGGRPDLAAVLAKV